MESQERIRCGWPAPDFICTEPVSCRISLKDGSAALAPDVQESTNCRLEAQYAFQQKKAMVPLMMEEGYTPSGWLGMLLGVQLWYILKSYLSHASDCPCMRGFRALIVVQSSLPVCRYGFYGAVLASEETFNGKIDELCRGLGEHGKRP